MRRRWTCGRWRRAAWSSPLLLAVLAGCGGGGNDAQKTTTAQRGDRRLPVVRADAVCPVSPTHASRRYGSILGDGPAYPSLTFRAHGVLEIRSPHSFGSNQWAGQKVLWVQRPGAPAGLTVTGGRLDGASEIRFDDGDVPALRRLVLPPPDPRFWAERPGYTRMRLPGCYGYLVVGPQTRETVIFRAVSIGHWGRPSDRVHGRSAQALERAIVEPRDGERRGEPAPSSATCRAPTRDERRANGYSGSPWEFICSIGTASSIRPYDVQVLPNWCYTATSHEHPGRFGIYGCRDTRS